MRAVFSKLFISTTLFFSLIQLIACNKQEATPSGGGETVGQNPPSGGEDQDKRLANEQEEFWIIVDKPAP